MVAVADTGFVVALIVNKDEHHAACTRVYQQIEGCLLPQSALTEVMYFVMRELGSHAAAQFLRGLPKSRMRIVPLDDVDIQRAGDLVNQYRDLKLDFVDATVIAFAERLNIKTILTVDQRDFRVVRPSHVEHFEILP